MSISSNIIFKIHLTQSVVVVVVFVIETLANFFFTVQIIQMKDQIPEYHKKRGLLHFNKKLLSSYQSPSLRR